MKKGLISLLTLALMTGCGANDQAAEQNDNRPQTITVKNSTHDSVDRKSSQQISKHLVELASSVPNVNDATAVVLGNYALVGIDVKEDIDRSQVGAIKYSVAESLRNDPYGARAVVIADPDMTARLREIQEDIQKGEPIKGIMNELADISGRLMPEIPAEITDRNHNNPIKEQENKLNKKEKGSLDQEQKDQSNHQLNKDNKGT